MRGKRTAGSDWRAIQGQLDYASDRRDGGLPDGEMHGIDEPAKGWNRASIGLNTHPLHPWPRVSQEDLLLPSARERLTLFGACLLCGACLSVLWVYFPIMLVAIPFNERLGSWAWIAMGVASVVSGVILFAYASAEDRRETKRALARY